MGLLRINFKTMTKPISKSAFQKLCKLGEGTYGIVYKAKNVSTQEFVALKAIKYEDGNDGIPGTAIREISLLKQLRHPNIVRLRDVAVLGDNLTLIFDYLDYDLKNYLGRTGSPLPIKAAKSFLYQILLGVNYCHSNRVIHRDIKPQNVLLGSDGVIKLADFGLARALSMGSEALTHEVITLWYRAPEILLGQKDYSLPVDIWSVGCIFAEMIMKVPIFAGDSEIDQIFKIFQIMGTPTLHTWANGCTLQNYQPTFPMWKPQPLSSIVKNLDPSGLDLLSRMLVLNPSNRINARNALRHVYT
jgi:cyclin-dependent kinase 2